MFFQGTLQEGIYSALQQSKQVVCFVTDEAEESQLWENEFLADNALREPIRNQAVALRLKAGSEEAGYLEALFPVPRKPTIVVIQNGQLREYIAAGTSKEEFFRRLGLALGVSSTQAPSTPAQTTQSQGHTLQSAAQNQPALSGPPQRTVEEDEGDLYGDAPSSRAARAAESSSSPVVPVSEPPSSSSSARVQAILAERAKRLEADKNAKEAKEKAEKEARAKERAEAAAGVESSSSSSHPVSASESSYAQMVRKRKLEEKEERQRILRRIEDDKRERKEREAQERQARLLLSATQDAAENGTSSGGKGKGLEAAPIPLTTRGGGGAHCNLQVRLFDGSTIRSRFSSDQTLGKDVRQWIDENRSDSDAPYTFRVVLTPLPNKAVEPSEEGETLLDLGLAPSSTLVLVPVPRVASAFEQGGGVFLRGWAYVYALFMMLFGIPGMLFRGRQIAAREEAREEIPLENLDSPGAARQKIRGFDNPDDSRRDQQLYNGNSLNFEPRRDGDNDDSS